MHHYDASHFLWLNIGLIGQLYLIRPVRPITLYLTITFFTMPLLYFTMLMPGVGAESLRP